MMRTAIRLTTLTLAATLTVAVLATPAPASAATKLRAISAGGEFTCAITAKGAAKCWGENSYGQLGDGTKEDSDVPVQTKGLKKGVASVEAGDYHACALKTNGVLFCWGYNEYGQLGDGTKNNDRPAPVKVKGIGKVASFSTGYYHTCAVTTKGAAKCWGRGDSGQLGDGKETSSPLPVQIKGMKKKVASVSGGDSFSCGMTTKGVAKCWGYNGYSTLGDGTDQDRKAPVKVKGIGKVRSITAGYYQTCAVTKKGAAKCWGSEQYGQLGNGIVTDTYKMLPDQVKNLTKKVTAVSPNYYFGCGLHKGAAKCWGLSDYGQLGNGKPEQPQSAVPVKVTAGMHKNVIAISSGWYHACGLLKNGTAKCWGYNSSGELGDRTDTTTWTPVKVKI